MPTHSSILAWRIPWMEEPDRLKSIGSQRSDLAHTYASLLYFGHLMQIKKLKKKLFYADFYAKTFYAKKKKNSLKKTLMLGKTEGKRRRGQQRIR